MPFANQILGGSNKLVRSAIESPNFVAGSAGWQVRKDGSAEFNNGVFRGTVTAGTFQGADFVITTGGAFFYSGTPAAGNLIASIAPAQGTDAYGNFYNPGVNIYGHGVTSGNLLFPVVGATAEAFPAFATSYGYNAGLADEGQTWQLFGSQETGETDMASIGLLSSAKDGSIFAQGSLLYYTRGAQAEQQCLIWGQGSNQVIIADLVAVQPGTTTTPETWHTAALSNSWTANNVFRYERTADGCVHLSAALVSPSGVANPSVITTLPSGYFSTTRDEFLPITQLNPSTNAVTAAELRIVHTSGAVQVYGVTAASQQLNFGGRYPLTA